MLSIRGKGSGGAEAWLNPYCARSTAGGEKGPFERDEKRPCSAPPVPLLRAVWRPVKAMSAGIADEVIWFTFRVASKGLGSFLRESVASMP